MKDSLSDPLGQDKPAPSAQALSRAIVADARRRMASRSSRSRATLALHRINRRPVRAAGTDTVSEARRLREAADRARAEKMEVAQ